MILNGGFTSVPIVVQQLFSFVNVTLCHKNDMWLLIESEHFWLQICSFSIVIY